MSTELFDGNAHLTSDEKALINATKETGDVAEVRRLLAAGVGVDICDGHNMPWDQTPLMLAARNGFLEIVQILLAAGASVSAVDKNIGESEGRNQPLHHAVAGGNIDVVKAILDDGADINALTTEGNTPLNRAIEKDNVPVAKLLIDSGAAVKQLSRKHSPPLYTACSGSVAIAHRLQWFEFLLAAGADVNAVHSVGSTPLNLTAAGDESELQQRLACLTILLKAGAKDTPSKRGNTALQTAIFRHQPEIVKLLLSGGVNPNQLTSKGTVLDLAQERVQSAIEDRDDESMADRFREDAGRSIAQLEEIIKILTAAGTKRKSELSPAELESAAPPKKSKSAVASGAPNEKQPPLGAAHFLELANNGEPECSLIAVEAPLDKVTEALSQRYKSAKLQQHVEIKKTRKNDELARYVALIQIKDNHWTIVLRSLFYVNGNDLASVIEDAKALSEKLKTKAISFVSEDTSGAIQFDLFDKGQLIEQAQWTDGGSFAAFESTRRKQPKIDEIDNKFTTKLFRELGIYLPACYSRGKAKNVCLCAEKQSLDRIEAANLLELGS